MGRLPKCGKTSHMWPVFPHTGRLPMYGRLSMYGKSSHIWEGVPIREYILRNWGSPLGIIYSPMGLPHYPVHCVCVCMDSGWLTFSCFASIAIDWIRAALCHLSSFTSTFSTFVVSTFKAPSIVVDCVEGSIVNTRWSLGKQKLPTLVNPQRTQ